jgi:hypothetical protein
MTAAAGILSIGVHGPLTETDSGELTGRISIRVDDWYFPEAEWRDFVFVLIGSWGTAIRDLAVSRSAVLTFMDGPFEVRLDAGSGDDVVAKFVSRTARGHFVERVVVTTRQQLAVAISDAIKAATWWSMHEAAEGHRSRKKRSRR